MTEPVDELTAEELNIAEHLLDERVRAASRERYRQMVVANDPELYRGPVRLSREQISELREEVRQEVLERRKSTEPAATESASEEAEKQVPVHRWPWQRR